MRSRTAWWRSTVLAWGIGVGVLAGSVGAAPFKVYIFNGQSNMGISTTQNFVAENYPELNTWLQSDENDVLFFRRGTSASSNQNEDGEVVGRNRTMGYEAMFGYHVARYWKAIDPEQRIAIVKVSQGATPMSRFLPAGRPAGPHWAVNGDYPWKREASVHVSLRECFEEAIDSLESKGHTWEGAGFFWYQGEGDAVEVISSNGAESYLANLNDLIVGADAYHDPSDPPEPGQEAKGDDPLLDRIMGWRDYLRNLAAPAVVARIMWYPDDSRLDGKWSGYNSSLVRGALTTFGDDPGSQPAAWINVDDLNTGDGTHLDGHSVVEAGDRFARAYLGLLDADNYVFPPKIDPTYRYFGDSIENTMSSRHSGAEIYYTLNGAEPTQSSSRYSGPVVIRNTVEVKARAYVAGKAPSEVRTVPLTRIDAWPATDAAGMEPGIKYYVYDIASETFPDFDQLTPTDSGITSTIDYQAIAPADSMYGIRFEGYVKMPVSTTYLFGLKTNTKDSSELTIDDSLVIDKEGTYCFHRTTRKSWFPLDDGLHYFRIDYYQFAPMDDSWNGTRLEFSYRNVFSHYVELNDSSSWFFHGTPSTVVQPASSGGRAGRFVVRDNRLLVTSQGPHKVAVHRLDGSVVLSHQGCGRSVVDLSSKRLATGTYVVSVDFGGRTALKRRLLTR